jgi:putative flippase GtrA
MRSSGVSIVLVGRLRQFRGFVLVGAANSVISCLCYLALALVLPYWAAFTQAFAIGILFSLWGNASLVFGESVTKRSASYFTAYYLISYTMSLAVLVGLSEGLEVPTNLAPLGVLVLLAPFNFFASSVALRAY